MALANLDSITKRLIAQEAGGIMARTYHDTLAAATTAATTTSGYITAQRFPKTFTVPSETGYDGWELEAEMVCEDVGCIIACLEYDLFTINTIPVPTTVNGVTMPSRDTRISGTDYTARQTASMIPMLTVSTAMISTTPTITTTYVNEDGTGSRVATMVLPTSVTLNTAFCMTPHLNSGDTAIYDVTAMTTTAASAGQLIVRGIIPFAYSTNSVALHTAGFSNILKPLAPVVAQSGDKVAFYHFGSATTKDLEALIFGRPI